MVSPAGFAASDSFQSGLEDAGRQYACPGEVVNYTCTIVDTSGNPLVALTGEEPPLTVLVHQMGFL